MPVIEDDELFWSMDALQMSLQPYGGYLYNSFQGRSQPYHGDMYCYIMQPFIYLYKSPYVFRVVALLGGFIILFLTYVYGMKLYNPFVGAIAVALLAVDYWFLYFVRIGGDLSFSIPIFTLAVLLFFYKWEKQGKWIYF